MNDSRGTLIRKGESSQKRLQPDLRIRCNILQYKILAVTNFWKVELAGNDKKNCFTNAACDKLVPGPGVVVMTKA